MQEKMIVLSMDAMVREDVAYLESRPHFARLMAGRAEEIGRASCRERV